MVPCLSPGGAEKFTQQIFCLPFSSQDVLTVGIFRNYTNLDDGKSSTITRATNHGSVGTLASANSPYFHPTVLIWSIVPNMQMTEGSIEGHLYYKIKKLILLC